MTRFLAVWFPDWSITAAGYRPTEPMAVIAGGQVVACSAAARRDGVQVGQRRREAKRHSPLVAILDDEPQRDITAFESVVAALTLAVPRLEVTSPGLCTIAAAGPTRYYGGESQLAQQLQQSVGEVLAEGTDLVRIGVADSRFAARLAASTQPPNQPPTPVHLVPAGQTSRFLAPFPIATLGIDELTTLSRRLGLHTLGQFAALPAAAVLSRFGTAAAIAHRLAAGYTDRPLAIHEAAEPLLVSTELDPPAQQVEMATFAARPLADDLIALLTRRGLACTQLRIEVETEHAEVLSRLWRASTVFDVGTIVERVRWQLAGWLEPGGRDPIPTAGIAVLRLAADEVADCADLQISLWGELSETDRRAIRGIDRVRGLLGPDGVMTAVIRGGRSPTDQTRLVPWGEPTPAAAPAMPWPGVIPPPAPALVHPVPVPVKVHGSSGPVGISLRGDISDTPTRIQLPDGQWRAITAWAGPWLADERWWDPPSHRRQARFQLLTTNRESSDASAHLCVVQSNQWWIEATYD